MANSSNAQIGAGVALSFWDTEQSPDAYFTIGKVRSISGFGVNRPEVESTTLDSTSVERIPGLPDGKQVTIVVTTTSAAVVIAERFRDLSSVDLKIVFPSPTSLTRYFTIAPLDDDMGTITPSGLMELTLQGRITGDISDTDPHA